MTFWQHTYMKFESSRQTLNKQMNKNGAKNMLLGDHEKKRCWVIKSFLGRPFDLRSLLTSSNNLVPYLYFILLSSTIISVGVSFARLLTKGKNPVIKRVFTFKFFKVIIMLILKFMVQSYVLSIAVKSFMYKFASKVKKHFQS